MISFDRENSRSHSRPNRPLKTAPPHNPKPLNPPQNTHTPKKRTPSPPVNPLNPPPPQKHAKTRNNKQAARLAADVCDVPTILVARTDALGAYLMTSDVDDYDKPFLTGGCLTVYQHRGLGFGVGVWGGGLGWGVGLDCREELTSTTPTSNPNPKPRKP